MEAVAEEKQVGATGVRVDLGVTPQAPHRPVRAELPHTVPQVHGFAVGRQRRPAPAGRGKLGAVLASAAIRWSLVEMGFELSGSFIVPSNGSMLPMPPSLHGVPSGPVVPASTVLWDTKTPSRSRTATPTCRSSRFASLPSLGGTTPRPLRSLCAGRWTSPPVQPGVWCGGPHRLVSLSGNDRASQVPGEPVEYMPSSPTPGRFPRQASAALRCCLPLCERRRPSHTHLTGLNHTACTLAVYAS